MVTAPFCLAYLAKMPVERRTQLLPIQNCYRREERWVARKQDRHYVPLRDVLEKKL